MNYAIAILPETYGTSAPVKFFADDENNTTCLGFDQFETIEEAEKLIDEWNDGVYVLGHNESGRPGYRVVEVVDADYVNSGRGGDMGNYDWDDCDCHSRDGDCCGECNECQQLMIDQDRDYIIDNAIGGKK